VVEQTARIALPPAAQRRQCIWPRAQALGQVEQHPEPRSGDTTRNTISLCPPQNGRSWFGS